MIYCIGGTKGGTGKSTLAIHLAIELSRRGQEVLLVDTDETETSTDFTAIRNEDLGDAGYTCVQLRDEGVRPQLQKLRTKYEQIVIDCGARDTTAQRAALSLADVYLVPFAPRTFDVWPVVQVSRLIKDAKAFNDQLQSFAVLNRADATGQENNDVAEELQGAEQFVYLDTPLVYRKAYNRAATSAMSVTEVKPRDPKAYGEFMALFSKLMEATNQQGLLEVKLTSK